MTIARLLGARGVTVFCGGLSVVMEAVSRGAKEEGGHTVGILPYTGMGNRYLDVLIRTGIGHARNVILVHSSDALIEVGGSYGTVSEIAISLKSGVTVCGLRSWEIPSVVICATCRRRSLRQLAPPARLLHVITTPGHQSRTEPGRFDGVKERRNAGVGGQSGPDNQFITLLCNRDKGQ
jgi:hypothetical protein